MSTHFPVFRTRVRRVLALATLLATSSGIGFVIPASRAEEPTAAAPAAEAPADAAAAEKPTAQDLLAAGDRLAGDKKYEEALTQYKNAYELIVPKIRGLAFKNTVQPRFMTRSQLKDYMANEIEKEIPKDELLLMDRSLKVLGFVPPTLNVEETLLNLYTEQVGGFYNPRSKEMFLILEDPVKRTFLTRWLSGPEFDSAEQRTTLAHEMTHALADQHYDLNELDKVATGNDDMAMAISALVEGEATLVMMSEMLGSDLPPELLVQLEPQRMDMTFEVMSWSMSLLGGRAMRAAPSIFRKTLVFPYHKGIVFVLNLTNRDGWQSIDRAFQDPPLSTEQILHPEKYWGERDEPTAISLPLLTERLSESWKRLGGNSLGELQLRILLENHSGGEEAAAGWDGDRYDVYESSAGALGLAWYTTWDSPEDARQFAALIAEYYDRLRRPAADTPADAQATFAANDDQRATWNRAYTSDEVRVEWRGSDTVILAGFSAAENEALAPLVWESPKAPLQVKR